MGWDLGRTVVVGFDGLDAGLVRAFLRAGIMPNLDRLSREGRFHEVLSTVPAESAVAWSSFNMEASPGQTGIFDFVTRRVGSYTPRPAGAEVMVEDASFGSLGRWGLLAGAGAGGAAVAQYGAGRISRRCWLRGAGALGGGVLAGVAIGWPVLKWLPGQRHAFRSTIRGRPWWDRLAAEGARCVAGRVPMTYPARAQSGVELLAGLGVPDLQGTSGTYRILADEGLVPGEYRQVIRLKWRSGQCLVQIPLNGLTGSRPARAQIRIRRLEPGLLEINAGSRRVVVKKGTWSASVPLLFSVSPLERLRGVVRMHYCAGFDGVVLYMTPVEIDPAAPDSPGQISWPAELSREMCAAIGPFRTIGWESQTWGLVDGVLDDGAYLADLKLALDANIAQLEWFLNRGGWDCLLFVFQVTDQAQHMFFDARAEAMRMHQEVDPEHPVVDLYKRVDEIVGWLDARARLGGWRLAVMSDHGFAHCRRTVNLNAFLARRGWLALYERDRWDPDCSRSVLASRPWENVDWFRTRAFAIGLAGVYLNVVGREPGGIVKRGGEYEYLQEKLASALMKWRDPRDGGPVVAKVYRCQEVYQGPATAAAPDLVIGLNRGYRVSSASAVGGITAEEIADNKGHWVGDHCGVDAALLPGLCVTSFRTDWPARVLICELARRIWPTRS